MKFTGKVALVTGAAVGIGRAVALQLAENGASLILADLDPCKLEAVRKEVAAISPDVLAFPCDVSDEARVNEIVASACAHFGKIDILVNNAALWRSHCLFKDIPTAEWKRYIDVNIMGVVYFSRAVLGQMLERKYGRIINVASVAGVYGNATMACYSATKGAVIAMSRALAKETTASGVLVNCVSPGSVSSSANPDIDFYAENPLPYIGRTGTDRENANLICFLASDDASYISGQNIQIDGCRKKI